MHLNILLKNKRYQHIILHLLDQQTLKQIKNIFIEGLNNIMDYLKNFNGSTKYLTDSKLLYKGFTKTYKPSHFHQSTDDKEYLKQFYLNPQTKPIELNTACKNKYPK